MRTVAGPPEPARDPAPGDGAGAIPGAPGVAPGRDLASGRALRVLLLEDLEEDAELVEARLEGAGLRFELRHVRSREDFLAALAAFEPDAILCDYGLPTYGGRAALQDVQDRRPEVPVLMVSGSLIDEEALELLRHGAKDWVLKGNLARLAPAVTRAVEEAQAARTLREREAEALARQVELARSNADLESFAWVASHDLKEPLRMVVSYLQLLERRLGPRLVGEEREFLQEAVGGGRRLAALVEALLDWARVSRGTGPQEVVDPAVPLGRAVAGLAAAIEESGARLSTAAPLPAVRADPDQLERLFLNLLGNAIKFRRGPGPRVEVSARLDGAFVEFRVRDDGIGIDPAHHQRVFGMFKRLHGRDEYPGTGIGLALALRIVERHGGRIWVESSPGQGATFCFTLPAAGP